MTAPPASSTPLDDFLAGADDATGTGDLLQQIGLVSSMLGLLLAGGLVVFVGAVHRGPRTEIAVLLRLVAGAAALAVAGAAVEIAGLASIDDLSWLDALTEEASAAAMMRLLAGAMIALGLFEHSIDVDERGADGEPVVRWVPATASSFAYAGMAIGALSFSFDGHTVSEGPRVVHALVDVVHVSAGSTWFGGVAGLAVVAWLRRGHGSVAPLIVRFSPVAGVALILVALAGSLMALLILDELGDLVATVWGRTLLAKVATVGVVVVLGAYNHFVVVPALERDGTAVAEQIRRARRTVTAEAVLLLAVVSLSMLLVGASPN